MPVTGLRDSTIYCKPPAQIYEQCYFNSVILTAVSYRNTRYSLLHLLALDGTKNNEDITTATRVSLQSSSELLSRKCTLQGRSCPVLGLQDVM